MPAPHADELPTLEVADLAQITGGAGSDLSSMLPMMMMMMRGRSQEVAPAPAAAAPAWTPKIVVDGVEQKVARSADGATFTSST